MRLPSLHSHPGRRAWHRSTSTPAGAQKDTGAGLKAGPPSPLSEESRFGRGTHFIGKLVGRPAPRAEGQGSPRKAMDERTV